MPNDRFAARRERLLRRLKTAGVDALLVTSSSNVRYLTGFTGEDSDLVIGRNVAVLVSDSRFETQIREECPGLDAFIRSTAQTRGKCWPRWSRRRSSACSRLRVERPRIRNGSRSKGR